MENKLRQFATICGGDYLTATVLNHLYYEACAHVAPTDNYTTTIDCIELSKELGIPALWIDAMLSGDLTQGVALIDLVGITGTTVIINPQRIESHISRCLREAGKVNSHNTRAVGLGNPGTLTIEEWIDTLNCFCWMCAYCGEGAYDVLEHIIPLTFPLGGTTSLNCVPACNRCNALKGPYHPDRFPPSLKSRWGERVAQIRTRVAKRQELKQRASQGLETKVYKLVDPWTLSEEVSS